MIALLSSSHHYRRRRRLRQTAVVRKIVENLGDAHQRARTDRYYKDHPELRLEERAALNDHPASLETDLLVRHVEALKAGRGVENRLRLRASRALTTSPASPAHRHHRQKAF